MRYNSDNLARKIACVNQTNDYANKLYGVLVYALRPFVGKKVVKQTGELTEALKKALPELPCNGNMHVHCSSYRSYSLTWEVRSSFKTGEHSCDYYTASVSVGRISNHELAEIVSTPPAYRTDITMTEILDKWEEYERKKEEADKARDAIPYQFQN